jgi:hypothetical protein
LLEGKSGASRGGSLQARLRSHFGPERGAASPEALHTVTAPVRPRLPWIIAAALVVVGAGLVAAIYGLRSNDNPPPTVASANQALLEKGGPVKRSCCIGPVKLLPGRVSTEALGMKASFEVFDHWFGEQGPGWLTLGKHLSTGGYEVDVPFGGIEVNALDSPLTQTVRILETAPGFRVRDVSPIHLDGYSGRRYSFGLNHLLGFRPGLIIGPYEHDLILLGVGHRTIFIRNVTNERMADYDQERRESERVIQSFRLQS